jgi:crossover junction endodeoxyribonuclease RuvC
MIRIGIDPGMTGAIAVLEGNILHACHDMPTVKARNGKNQVNIPELASILRQYRGETVFLEAVHAMPGQGVTSCFNFGMGFGAIQGIVQTLGIPMHLVTPQKWKKAAGLIGSDKDYARTKALQLYPDADLARKKDIGRADAILIARYG